MPNPIRLGTAVWKEGSAERRALVAPLPSDAMRVVDLNRMERMRLGKLGEGRAEALAEVLVPASLRQVLDGGPRALQRVAHALAYAEKWHRRGDLPDSLALRCEAVRLLPCLPRPSTLRKADGTLLDRFAVLGPGAVLGGAPQPTIAAVGQHGGRPAGFCLALENAAGAVLGGWLTLEWPEGLLELRTGGHHRSSPLDAWDGLTIPRLRSGEAFLLPPPRLKPLPGLTPDSRIEVVASFETLTLALGPESAHPTVQ